MELFSEQTSLEKILIQKAIENKHPITGSIELTPLCNMNCDMCYIRLSPQEMIQKGHLHTISEWLNIAQQMKNAGTLFLLLTGGEPLLYPDFKQLYLELIAMGFILTINTNGTLIDAELAEFFKKNKPRRINVTLYGSSNDTYESLCHYSDGYNKTLRGIYLLKKHNIDVKINGSITPKNENDLDQIFEIGHKLDIPVHIDTYMVPCNRERNLPFNANARLSPQKAALANIQVLKNELSGEAFHQYVQNTISVIEKNSFPHSKQMTCLAGKCSFAINWQGEMRPCVTFSNPSFSVFNLGFDVAWKKIVSATSELLINQKCSTCSLRPVCKTCAACAFCETGTYDGLPNYNCQYSKEFVHLLYSELNN